MRGTAVRRLLGTLPLVGAITLTTIACASGSTAAATDAESRTPGTRVRIVISKIVLTARLWDNATARSLIDQLPLTLSFRDFNAQEKIARVKHRLSMHRLPPSADPAPRDIGYYAPTGDLVFYYTDVARFDGIALMGRFDGSIAAIRNQTGAFTARIEFAR